MAMKEIRIGGFKGGLNTRDRAGELAPEEIPDALNVTIDERGSAQKRLGYERRYSTAVSAALVSNLFYWQSRGFVVSQIGTTMHINNGAAFHTWSTSDRVGMCEFLGNLIMIHPVDGVRSYNGTAISGPFTNFPVGNTCSAWQGKCWFGGNPSNPSRVHYTDIAALTMGVNNWVDIREKDDSKITCLTGASGLDISGRPGLLVFKKESAYRIYDASTGAYNTIDSAIGCGSNIGAVSAYGRTYVASIRGIYYTDGINPMVEASTKIENFFHEDQLNTARHDLFAAGRYQDRLWFSFPAEGETRNTIAIEHHPHSGWVMAHNNAMACYAAVGPAELVCGSPVSNGLIFNLNRGGADDGAAISSYMQAYWTEPNDGNKTRIRRMRVVGLGEFDVTMQRDWELGNTLPTRHVELNRSSVDYDDPGSIYDTVDVYGPTVFQMHQDFWSIGTCRSLSVRVEETSTLTLSGREILGIAEPEQGAWSLGYVQFLAIELGFR